MIYIGPIVCIIGLMFSLFVIVATVVSRDSESGLVAFGWISGVVGILCLLMLNGM